MAAKWIEKLTGPLEDKKRYRQTKARAEQLPPSYRTAVDAVQRYLMYAGGGDGAGIVTMYEDLVDLFEQSAASGIPVRDVVGEDPVDFVEAFVANYPQGQWRVRERNRLVDAIERASGQDDGSEGAAR
jgi:DNA-binding ferritin-like protein (Dps family)